jgi:hypothetical protein
MGYITFIGMLRKGSSGQIIVTVPKKFRSIVSTNHLVYIKISSNKKDIKEGESIDYEK